MNAFDWMRAGPAIRGTPPRGRLRGRGLLVAGLLAVLAFTETGCRSGGCSNCGLLSRTSARFFNHRAKAATATSGCCGDSVVGETFVGDAPASYTSPGVVVPGPSGTIPSSPTIEDSPSSLEPIPKAKIESRSSLSPGKTSYDNARPASRAGRPRAGTNLVQSSDNTPVPASRSARGLSVDSQADADNPLDRLPPLDLPTEVTERTQTPTPPLAPLAERTSAEKPASAVKTEAPAAKKVEIKATEPEKTSGSASPLPLSASNSATGPGAPGIKRVVPLDMKLAAGSTPSTQGLDWLVEKGFKTLLDLREPKEVDPAFSAEVTGRGIRYIPFPIDAKAIDADHVARFNMELAISEALPLYFFDNDGTRPGALWYVRRITKDNVDPQIARRDAEEIGLTDKAYWLAAKTYVEKSEAAKIGQLPNDSDIDTETKPASTSGAEDQPRPVKIPSTASSSGTKTPAKAAETLASVETATSRVDPETSAWLTDVSSPFRQRAAWQPYTALLTTGLTVPIAYWSSSVLPVVFTNPVPSLPVMARQTQALPSSSGG